MIFDALQHKFIERVATRYPITEEQL